jgi:hypothetical protein
MDRALSSLRLSANVDARHYKPRVTDVHPSKDPIPTPTDIAIGALLWLDLQSSDTGRSIEFYSGVFG